MNIRRMVTELLDDSPRQNLAKVARRLGLSQEAAPPKAQPAQNKVIEDVLASSQLPLLIEHALRRLPESSFLLAGNIGPFPDLTSPASPEAKTVSFLPLTWADAERNAPALTQGRLILTLLPVANDEWETVERLRKTYGGKMTLLLELLLPYSQVFHLHGALDYFNKKLDNLLQIYLGKKVNPAVEQLNGVYPLKGKSVIEFGPLDGAQTASLMTSGVQRLTCIEARPENVVKTRTAAEVFGWQNVQVSMDDFHNVSRANHGQFDLCFAHGVYYHSVAPFVFLENLRTLSETIFLGGYCATDELPPTPYLDLPYEGRTYRVKRYREANNSTAGINRSGYYFAKEDLARFFTERGHQVQVVAEIVSDVSAGNYSRLLITKR